MTLYDVRIWTGVNPTASGSITLNGTTAVVGSGTTFLSRTVGDVLVINGEARSIATITDDTHLALTLASAQSAAGLDYVIYPLSNVETLISGLPPEVDFVPYSKPIDLLDSTQRGMGWATATWKWGWLTLTQRNVLKALCSGKSLATYIKTKGFNRTYSVYSATLIWPDREEYYASKVLNFVLNFRAVTAV